MAQFISFHLCVFVGKGGLLCLHSGSCLTVCLDPGFSVCPDPVSRGLIGVSECEAAFCQALPASAAICLSDVAAFHC